MDCGGMQVSSSDPGPAWVAEPLSYRNGADGMRASMCDTNILAGVPIPATVLLCRRGEQPGSWLRAWLGLLPNLSTLLWARFKERCESDNFTLCPSSARGTSCVHHRSTPTKRRLSYLTSGTAAPAVFYIVLYSYFICLLPTTLACSSLGVARMLRPEPLCPSCGKEITLSGGSLGSCVDEERSQLCELM